MHSILIKFQESLVKGHPNSSWNVSQVVSIHLEMQYVAGFNHNA